MKDCLEDLEKLLVVAAGRVQQKKAAHEVKVHKLQDANKNLLEVRSCCISNTLDEDILTLEARIREKAPQAIAQGVRQGKRLASAFCVGQVIRQLILFGAIDYFNAINFGII